MLFFFWLSAHPDCYISVIYFLIFRSSRSLYFCYLLSDLPDCYISIIRSLTIIPLLFTFWSSRLIFLLFTFDFQIFQIVIFLLFTFWSTYLPDWYLKKKKQLSNHNVFLAIILLLSTLWLKKKKILVFLRSVTSRKRKFLTQLFSWNRTSLLFSRNSLGRSTLLGESIVEQSYFVHVLRHSLVYTLRYSMLCVVPRVISLTLRNFNPDSLPGFCKVIDAHQAWTVFLLFFFFFCVR